MSTEPKAATSEERGASIATAGSPDSDLRTFLDELLAEQQRLQTPVARAADAYERAGFQPSAFSVGPFRELIPLSAPGPGEQYAFEVDLDACSGCKACVAGCHSLNGLDENETWRDVGVLLGGDHRHPFQQTITSACHHCADPACANGCPVLAYEKDPVTGIVRHLDDQCIGCSYCILKCPYDVPKYNKRLGIVRKCDMCHGRLAAGEAPACVQACPTHAIKITKVSKIAFPAASLGEERATFDESTRSQGPVAQTESFLPGAPDPSYTRPTTRYLTRRTFPAELRAGDSARIAPQPAHWPLVALLTLMAMAVGCSLTDKIFAPASPALAALGWGAGAIGLAFSVLHLGQPTRAWRIFLGLRKSWLSREAVAFGVWFPLATVYTTARLGWWSIPGGVFSALALGTALIGGAGLFCSAMIYADTRREFWRAGNTIPRIFGSAIVLGLACAFAVTPSSTVAVALGLAVTVKLAIELRALRPLDTAESDDPTPSPPVKTARLLTGELGRVFRFRLLAGLLVIGAAAAGAQSGFTSVTPAVFAMVGALGGELAERYLFFRAVVAPKMPGLPSAPATRRRAA